VDLPLALVSLSSALPSQSSSVLLASQTSVAAGLIEALCVVAVGRRSVT
jgi:hypothetical protein